MHATVANRTMQLQVLMYHLPFHQLEYPLPVLSGVLYIIWVKKMSFSEGSARALKYFS